MNDQVTELREHVAPYGAMRSVMPDHIYVPAPNSQIYTSPCIVAHVSTPFDVMVALTACRKSFSICVNDVALTRNAMVVGSGARTLDASGAHLVLIQFNPLHPIYHLLRGQRRAVPLNREAFAPFDRELEGAYRGELTLPEAQALYQHTQEQLMLQLDAVPPIDPRVHQVMLWLYENPRLQVEELATRNHLSYDRMSHLFMDELGISIRSFQVWVKLFRAMSNLRYGQSIAQLSQVAGFSDAAHLSRVFKNVYGAPPSYFFFSGNVKLVASHTGPIPGTPLPDTTRSVAYATA